MKIKMLNRRSSAAILLSLLIGTSQILPAQVRVTKVTGPDMLAGKKGIVYTLPRTQIHIGLWIEKTQQIPGPLAEFAGEFLGIDQVITESVASYAIKDAAILTSTESDPDQAYLIEKEEKSSGEIWISFSRSAPVLTLEKFDKTVTPENFVSWNDDLFITPKPGQLYRKYTESPPREMIDTIIRKVSIDTLVLEEKTFKHYMVELTDREKAQEAAGQIRQIEQDKYKLLTGYQETAYSREAIEFMYNKLEEQRLEYLKLFTGIIVKETLKFDYQLFPEAGKEEQKYSLAGFSNSAGIVSQETQNGISLTLKSDSWNTAPVITSEAQPSAGVAYRMPQSAQAVLSVQGKELVSRRIEVLQLGSILTLPPEFKRIDFDLETGALKSIVME
jgi:hypothetical protein